MTDVTETFSAASAHSSLVRTAGAAGRTRRRVGQAVIYVLLIGYGLVSLYPFLWMVSASFKDRVEVVSNGSLIPIRPTLDTLVNTWNNLDFFAYFGNSLVITGFTTLGVVVIYSLASYAFAVLRFPGKTFLYRFFLLLLFVPSVTVLLPIVLLEKQLGILGTQFGLILPMINGTAPLSILILTAALQAVPRDLREAAVMDGASEWRIFRSIYLPVIRPALVTVALLTAIPAWNEYVLTSVSLTDSALFTLPLGLNQLASGTVLEYNNLMAGALIVVIPVIIAFISLQRYFINGLAGAVKG